MVKAHIGSKILTSIVQESQTNIQPASESDSDSDRVERMVGSTSISSELNYSGDQAADSQHDQDAEETIPEFSTSRCGQQRTRVRRENCVPWNNIHVDRTYNKTPNKIKVGEKKNFICKKNGQQHHKNLIKRFWKRCVILPSNSLQRGMTLPFLVLTFTNDPPLWGFSPP